MADLNIVALVVAILGAGGIGAAVREIASVISLARKGISGKEDQRRSDIIAQRDAAIARAAEAQEREDAADARADREARIRRQWQEEAAKLRRLAIERGEDVGPWPDIEDTTENPWRNPS